MADKVLFLVHKDEDSPVFAVFPRIVGTNDPHTMLSYEHVGQHGSAHMDYVDECRLATGDEFKSLKAELERIGYELVVGDSTGQLDFEFREAELERMAA